MSIIVRENRTLLTIAVIVLFIPTAVHGDAPTTVGGETVIESSEKSLDDPATMARIRERIGVTLRAEATAESDSDRNASMIELCDWYALIRSRREFDDFSLMQAEATTIRNRLLRCKRKLSNRLKRSDVVKPDRLSQQVDSMITQLLAEKPGLEALSSESPVGAGAGAGFDTGWELVELITRTVDPETWETNGGDATIRYLASKRVLVVSASTETHEDLEALLNALR